jgi:DNA-binding NtrC family response regulator
LKAAKQRIIEEFERDYLTRLMREHNGNVSRAALAAGKERRDLGKLLKKYQIDPKLFHMADTESPTR